MGESRFFGEALPSRWRWAVPLLGFGLASLAAVPLYEPNREPEFSEAPEALKALGAFPVMAHPGLITLYWAAVLLVGTWLAASWSKAKGYPVVAAVGLAAVPVSAALDVRLSWWDWFGGTGGGVILLAAAVVLRQRRLVVPALVPTLAGTALLLAAHPAVGQFTVLGTGLFALAAALPDPALRTTVAAFAVAVCLTAAFAPVGYGSVWEMSSVVVLPGLVLVVGGLVGLRRRGAGHRSGGRGAVGITSGA